MKIAIVDLVFHWPPQGGSWVDVQGTAAALAARGHAVKIFTPLFTDYFPRGVICADPGVAVETIPFTRYDFNIFAVPRRYYARVRKYAPDVVLVTDGYFLKPHLINEMSRHFPVVTRFYAYELFCWRNTLFTPLTDDNCDNTCLRDQRRCYDCCPYFSVIRAAKRFLCGENIHFQHEFYAAGAFLPGYAKAIITALKNSRQIIVYNRYIADLVRQHNREVSIIPTGIILPARPKRRVDANAGNFTVFFPGRTGDSVKGFAVLREAVRLLRARGHALRIWYTRENSSAPDCDADFTNLGWLSGPELQPYYEQCDAVVNCSFWREAFGITVIEAMAWGKPVIASRIGGMRETISDGIDGLHVKPRDAADLAEKLELLIGNSELRQRLGAAARATVRNKYTWPAVIARTEAVLRSAGQA